MVYATPASEFSRMSGHHPMKAAFDLHNSSTQDQESHIAYATCGKTLNDREMEPGLNIDDFKVPAASTSCKAQSGMNGGRWTEKEHQSFLVGLRLYGREWKKVASKIRTRTSAQIRSHAQKYFAKISRDDQQRRKDSGESLSHSPVKSHDETNSQPSDMTTIAFNGYSTDSDISTSPSNTSDHGDTDGSVSYRSKERTKKQKLESSYRFGRGIEIKKANEDGYSLVAPIKSETLLFPLKSKVRQSFSTQLSRLDTLTPRKYHRDTEYNVKKTKTLPSQEELIESVAPNVRHRLSSLIEAELCALQVLSYYTLFQIDQPCPSKKRKLEMNDYSSEETPLFSDRNSSTQSIIDSVTNGSIRTAQIV